MTRRNFLRISAAGVVGLALSGLKASASSAKPSVAINPALVYQEAPSLKLLVQSGKLPPVVQRLPTNPLVLRPITKTGIYGGRLRSYYGWEGQWEESQYGHSPLRWLDDGLAIGPGLLDQWSTNADNSIWTLHMREGLKWSDGKPCTMDDVMFWWNDLSQSKDAANIDAVPDFGQDANGNLVTFTKVNNYTLKLTYGTPAPLTAKRLAMWVNGNIGPRWIAPKHYLQQFLPKYNPQMKDMSVIRDKILFRNNPECPSLDPWLATKFEAGVGRTTDRNPYYYAVDTEGNQLPYIDAMDGIEVLDHDVKLQKIRQGGIDFQNFTELSLADIATLKANQAAGGYDVYLWDTGSGTGMMYFWNYDHPDEKMRNLYRTPEFKQAMSFALDRPTIQKVIYYDTGTLTTGTLSPKAFEFNFNAAAQAFGKKAREIYAAYDPTKARTLLDKIGCKVGLDGKRTMPDGSKLEVRIDLPGDASQECTDVLDIAKKNWEAVGLTIVVNQMDPAAFGDLWLSGKGSIHTNWEVGDGPDHLLYPSWMVPNEPDRWAPLSGRLLQFAGTPQENTETEKSPWDREPPRFNKMDPEYMGSEVEKIHALYAQAVLEPDEIKRASLVWQMWTIHMESGPFFIGTVANFPRPIIVSKKLMNIPTHDQLKLGGFVNPWIIPYPAVTNPETWSFKSVPMAYLPLAIR